MRAVHLVVPILLALVGCGRSTADELLDTARLEELQNNPTHARALYEEIVRKYPGSAQARTADERLRALGSAPPH
jgi:TolA-binding protein